MKKILAMAMVGVMMVAFGACALAENRITVEDAKRVALEKVGMTAEQVTFTKAHLDNDDGRLEYEIEFVANGMEYEFDIDANTASIIELDIDRIG